MNPNQESSKPSTMQVVSLLRPEAIKELGGMPREAIVGWRSGSTDGKILPENFQANPAFIQFMHQIIKTFGFTDPALHTAAKQQEEGWVYIIDLRTPEGPQGRVPPEDIVGAFQVKDGKLLQESYWANNDHRVFSVNGLVKLPPTLHEALIRELKQLKLK